MKNKFFLYQSMAAFTGALIALSIFGAVLYIIYKKEQIKTKEQVKPTPEPVPEKKEAKEESPKATNKPKTVNKTETEE